jgi:heme exporter protein A
MLLVQNLSLERLDKKIFENINFSLGTNKIVMLKGRNGSGKTSLLKSVLCILEPTSGSMFWKGKPINKTLYDFYNNVTYISDKTSSVRQLTIANNIKIWKRIFLSKLDKDQIDGILSNLNLTNLIDKKVNTLSLGEIKKLELLRLVLEEKKIWILDEPLNNLDSDTIEILAQTFEDHCDNGGSILFSTHQELQINSEKIVLK